MKRRSTRSPRASTGSASTDSGPTAAPRLNTQPAFDADQVTMQRRMRFNPLRMLDPENLSIAHDQFDIGILRPAALLWDAMIRRDDTLSFVVPQFENAIAGKPWGVYKRKNVDERQAARHAAALEYFYANVTATNAFDRNERGDRHLLLKQMGSAFGFRYALHHFVWEPSPGEMIEVDGAEAVPALTATLEFVPLWYFENTTGTMRFLPFGGFGAVGEEMDFDGEWMCTTGPGIMFAAAACYVFKRLAFQDWTVFNERYAQQKVLGQTPESKDSPQGQSMAHIVADFNGDQGIVLYGSQPGDKPPISLLGPAGTVSVDLFERFLERQDRKMTVMFRGSDLRNMSREKDVTGVSAQSEETEAMELAHCASIGSTCRTSIDRMVIRYCFGEGVEPLAYFGLPDMDKEDAQQLRDSAGFLADRGVLVEADTMAERLGVTLTDNPDEALQPSVGPQNPDEEFDADDEDEGDDEPLSTGNAAKARRLERLIEIALRTHNGGPGSGRYPKGSGRGRINDHLGRRIDESQGGLSTQENIQRGTKAADYARRKQRDVRDAMYRKEVGRIDFLWGTPGNSSEQFAGGKGISHLLAKHGEADLKKLPVVLAKGKITPHPEGETKRLVSYGNYTASLVKSKSRQAWVLTGFSKGRQVNR